MKADALKAAELTLRSDFAGVDLIINSETGEHAILEVNEAPAIQTGADPDRKIAALMTYMQTVTGDRGDE
jgi:D-alanine-D-alanine ligase-like ATP-grasp enzyme